MSTVVSGRTRAFVMFVLALCCGAVRADAADVMLVLDLPPAAADAATQTQSVQHVAAALPPGARLGIVSADKPGGNLRTALMPAAEAATAFAAIEPSPAVDKDPAAAFERALYELRITGRGDVRHAIVFVGDAVPAAAERRQWLRDSLTADAARMSTPVFVVAWGETADIELAQTMARTTGGDYFRAASVADIEALMPRLKDMLDRQPGTPPATAAPVAEVESVPEPAPATSAAPSPVAPPPVATTSPVDPGADRLAGWLLAALVGVGAALGGGVAWWVARRHAPQAGRGAVRATPTAYLVDVNGVTPLSRYVLGSRPVMIGRVAGKDTRLFDYITVPMNTVSRRHAVIEYREGAYWVVDQGSVNGTRVNNKRIKGKRALQHGDRIGLHRCELQFEHAIAASDGDQTVGVTDTLSVVPAAAAVSVAPAAVPARAEVTRTEPPAVDPTVVLSLSDVASPSPADVTGPGVVVEAPAARKSTLDSFISTTLIQSPPANATLPTRPELPPRVVAEAPPAPTETAELSIDDFLDTGDAFAFADDPPAVAESRPPQQTTQKLEAPVEGTDVDEYRLGDTINLFEPMQPVEETTPLEKFLREHGGEPPRENNVLQGAWEQSRKK